MYRFNTNLKSMPEDALDSVSDPEVLQSTKSRLRVCDAADEVSSKLSVICTLLSSDDYSKLSEDDRLCAETMIYDTLSECIDLLRDVREL